MIKPYDKLIARLKNEQHSWLITGVAGFIGSNLLECLLQLNQNVIGLDNFSTGHQRNLDEVQSIVGMDKWSNFHFIEGDIRNLEDCRRSANEVDYVLHQAALGSVPRSLENPIQTNSVNIHGFLNMIEAAKQTKVKRFIYAASSSTYGDHPSLPKIENVIGSPLSPYAVTKYVNEMYASVYFRCYGLKSSGLRYFNVFGSRQDPSGPYSAVIPRWIDAMLKNQDIYINGDGETSRDFCYVDNVIQANILAALSEQESSQVYNIAYGERSTLKILFELIKNVCEVNHKFYLKSPIYREFREGDVLHSHASIDLAKLELGYSPQFSLEQGIRKTVIWHLSQAS